MLGELPIREYLELAGESWAALFARIPVLTYRREHLAESREARVFAHLRKLDDLIGRSDKSARSAGRIREVGAKVLAWVRKQAPDSREFSGHRITKRVSEAIKSSGIQLVPSVTALIFFACAEEPGSRQKIADHLRDGVYFEHEARYGPSPPTGNLEVRGEQMRRRVVEEIRQHIQLTRDVMRFEFERDALTDDAWTMLDSIANEIIKEGDGILYAYEDGFYGAGLKVIARLRK